MTDWTPAAGAAARPKPPAKSATPASPLNAPGWLPENEWLLAGNYAEASDENGISLAFVGAAPCSGVSRKALIFQIGSPSHYKAIDLTGMNVVVLVEGPAHEPVALANRARWRRADLLVSEQADSLQVEALLRALSLTLSGTAGTTGTAFTHVDRVSLGVGMSKERTLVSSSDRLDVTIRPLVGGNPVNPPQLQNQSGPFPFLGYLSLARVDTLFYAPAGGDAPWKFSGTAGVISTFGWSSERVDAPAH